MKKNIIILFILLLGIPLSGFSQVHVAVELSNRSVYAQQPFRINITVYTTTWFTAPLEFGNLQIPGAFIVPFDNSQPGMFTIGGKQYPGVQFYFIVFPYKVGSYSIPPLEITATSPPEGSSVGKKVVLHTAEEKFEVKDVPNKLKESSSWFVAKGVNIREAWNRDLGNLKVGDVIKRSITVDARGTLPQFIPDLTAQEQVKWASVYPQAAVLTDMRNEADANGRSVQQTTYLLEKAGDFTIPPIEVSYWNPNSLKIFSEKTPERKIHVADNPNLGILTTLKDSLDATLAAGKKVEQKGPTVILGLRLRAFIPLVILALAALYVLIRLCVRAYARLKTWRYEYLRSEKYLFRRLMKTKSSAQAQQAMYAWWDKTRGAASPSITYALAKDFQYADAELLKKNIVDIPTQKSNDDLQKFKINLKHFRKLLKEKSTDKNEPSY